MKLLSGYDVHTPLLNRLKTLVQQRPFCDKPDLGWITANYLDPAYIDRLLLLAKPYGVQRLIFDDGISGSGGYFHWARDLRENKAIHSWLNHIAEKIHAAGLRFGLWVSPQDHEILKCSQYLDTDQIPNVELYSETSNQVLDALGQSVGRGKLPYLQLDRLIHACEKQKNRQTILIKIDDPETPGETLAGWANVFGLSFHLLTGQNDSATVEQAYLQTCFGENESVKQIFKLTRSAVDKSFRVLNCFEMMDRSRWPNSLNEYDRQLEIAGPNHPLYTPDAQTISKIDDEKIQALEDAHDACRLLEQTNRELNPRDWLWLEHHLLHLKTLCLVLRMIARGYFKLRGRQTGKISVADHVFRSVHKQLYETIGNKQAILGEFATQKNAPLAEILNDFKNTIVKK